VWTVIRKTYVSFKLLFAGSVMMLLGSHLGTSATVIYNNGSPNQADAEDISEFTAADDFILSSNAIITGATFWASADVDPFTSQFSGTVGWGIFGDNAGEPGALLASGYDSAPKLMDTGIQIFGTEEYKVDLALPMVTLGSGHYWLGLHEGAFGTPDDGSTIYWDTTGSQTESLPMITSDLAGSGGWFQGLPENNLDLAFQLEGNPDVSSSVPEPNLLLPVLMVSGGCLLLRRHLARQRQRHHRANCSDR
jgi:hypothetical protein